MLIDTYWMTCDVLVNPGITVSMEPGVLLYTSGGLTWTSAGTTQIHGSSLDKISILSANPSSASGLISFDTQGSGNISFQSIDMKMQ